MHSIGLAFGDRVSRDASADEGSRYGGELEWQICKGKGAKRQDALLVVWRICQPDKAYVGSSGHSRQCVRDDNSETVIIITRVLLLQWETFDSHVSKETATRDLLEVFTATHPYRGGKEILDKVKRIPRDVY